MCSEAHGNQKTNEYQDDHICSILKALIDGAVPWVQDIWVAYYHMEILGFYTHGQKPLSMRSIILEYFGQLEIYGPL